MDQLDFSLFGLGLSDVALNLIPQLRDALLELRFLPRTCLLPQIKKIALGSDGASGIGFRIAPALHQIGRKTNLRPAVSFCLETGVSGRKIVDTLHDDRRHGASLSFVETDNDLSRLDVVAIAHEQFADNTSGWMLHLLDAGIDDDSALGNHGARQFGGERPAADAKCHENDDGRSGNEISLYGLIGRCVLVVHYAPPAP